MFTNYKEFEQAIHDYLCDIINGYGGFPDYYEEFQQDLKIIIKTCIDQDYIDNAETWNDANGSIHIGYIKNVYVTLKGYQFINEFEDNALLIISKRAEKRARISTFISLIAILISFVTLFVELASNYKDIIDFIKFMKSF